MWWVYALLSAWFAALTTIFAKMGVSEISPNLATAVRTVVVLIFAWLIVLVTGDLSLLRSLSHRALLFLVLSGLATGLSWMCFFHALQSGLASSVSALDKTSLVMTLALAMLFLGEPIQAKSLAGILMVVAGTILLVR